MLDQPSGESDSHELMSIVPPTRFSHRGSERSGGETDEDDLWSSLSDLMTEVEQSARVHAVKSFWCFNKQKQSDARVLYQRVDKALKEAAQQIKQLAMDSDLPDVQGNGYWSLLRVLACCLQKLSRKAQRVSGVRGSCASCSRTVVRSDVKDFANYARILEVLQELLASCLFFQERQKDENRVRQAEVDEGHGFDGNLFFRDVPMHRVHERFDKLDRAVLYGDMHGYQYPTRLKHFLRVVVLAAATHSRSMRHREDACQCWGLVEMLSAAKHSVEYCLNPDSKGQRVAHQYNHGDIEFLKSFWNLTETPLSRQFGKVVGSFLAQCRVFDIDGSSPIRMLKADGEGEAVVNIAPTDAEVRAYCGEDFRPPTTLPCRLLSYRSWRGQRGAAGGDACPNLIVHFHGGGFVAQSSASHETYLRDWAKRMDCPILSVDYGLGPEHPFPVAIEQVFYAYCWALQHAAELGSTAENVVCVGDSAGGNLAASIGLRCAEEGVRPPSGIVMLYPVLFLHLVPSPSRCLTQMDSLLPLGSLELCMDAYCGGFQRAHSEHQHFLSKFPNQQVPGQPLSALARRRQHHLSPVVAPDSLLARFPPCAVMASELDPLLDDSITFVKRLRSAKKSNADVRLKIAKLLPHGWLNMYFVGDQTSIDCAEEACVWMEQMLGCGQQV